MLVVEDEEMVLKLASKVLKMSGFDVLTAPNGAEALRLAGEHRDPIALLLSDVVMPNMSGGELSVRLKESRPEMKILFMSGYPGDSMVSHGVSEKEVSLLQKPFTPDELVRKIREVLDAPGA